MPVAVHPNYRKTARTIVRNQHIDLVEVPYDQGGGHTPAAAFAPHAGSDITAIVIPQPNFFGILEDVDEITDWAHAQGALVIGVVNPVAMALLRPPSLPGGGVISVNTARLSPGTPELNRVHNNQASQNSPLIVANNDRDIASTLTIRRRK